MKTEALLLLASNHPLLQLPPQDMLKEINKALGTFFEDVTQRDDRVKNEVNQKIDFYAGIPVIHAIAKFNTIDEAKSVFDESVHVITLSLKALYEY